jgi:hypothetical protein
LVPRERFRSRRELEERQKKTLLLATCTRKGEDLLFQRAILSSTTVS